MEWHLRLEGQSFSDLTVKKRHIMERPAPETEEGWCALAAVALEVIGLRQAVRMGDPRLWRQAVSELNTMPLAPLNLPLPVWELYLAHPYEGVTLRMHDGQQVAVPDWSKLYYSWHSRWFALSEEKVVKVFDGAQISGGEAVRSPNIQNTILERLLWLQKAESEVGFVVRTREGRGLSIQGKTTFRVDPSGSLLIVKRTVSPGFQAHGSTTNRSKPGLFPLFPTVQEWAPLRSAEPRRTHSSRFVSPTVDRQLRCKLCRFGGSGKQDSWPLHSGR